jgi:hypothetical protein
MNTRRRGFCDAIQQSNMVVKGLEERKMEERYKRWVGGELVGGGERVRGV